LKKFQLSAEIGCKVTHFPSVMQIFSIKNDLSLHIQGAIVQKVGCFSCHFYPYYANLNEKLPILLQMSKTFCSFVA